MEVREIREIGYVLAGYYAACCEANGGKFCVFGADSINHCYEYKEIVDSLEIPYTENGFIDTESYRFGIETAIFQKYGR